MLYAEAIVQTKVMQLPLDAEDCTSERRLYWTALPKPPGSSCCSLNPAVMTNMHTRHLYERLGFAQMGTVSEGFRMKDSHFETICLYYHTLQHEIPTGI